MLTGFTSLFSATAVERLLAEDAIRSDLEANWAVVAEGIQTILRREGYSQPYEALLAHLKIQVGNIGRQQH